MLETTDCPRCGGTLHLTRTSSVGVGTCEGCGGLWLSTVASDTVEAALSDAAFIAAQAAAQTTAPHAPATEPRSLPCPECKEPMARWPVAGVDVDHCAAHGTFYDRTELVVVARGLRARMESAGPSGLELARAPTGKGEVPPPPRHDPTPSMGAMRTIAMDARRRELARRGSLTELIEDGRYATYGPIDDPLDVLEFLWRYT